MKKYDWFKITAHFFSLVFHPVFIPLYTVILYFYLSPRFFVQQNIKFLILYLSMVSIIIPLLFFAVLFRSKAIAVQTEKPRERFFLSVIMTVVYIIVVKKIIHFHQYIELFPFFTGVLFSIAVLAIFNYFYKKPSIHATAMSGAIAFFLIWSYYSQINILSFLSLFILSAAIVIASRLYLKMHTSREILCGLAVGISMQIIAFYLILQLY